MGSGRLGNRQGRSNLGFKSSRPRGSPDRSRDFWKARPDRRCGGGTAWNQAISQRGFSAECGRSTTVRCQMVPCDDTLRGEDPFQNRPSPTAKNWRRRSRGTVESGMTEQTHRAALLGIVTVGVAIRVRLGVKLGVQGGVRRDTGQHEHQPDQDKRERPSEEPGHPRGLGRVTVQTDCN